MPEHIIIKPAIAKLFDEFMRQGRVLFLSAPCGFGKTVVADALLSEKAQEKKILRLNAGTTDFSLPDQTEEQIQEPTPGQVSDWDILMIDDLQLMQEEEEWQTLCELIRTETQKRFVLLSRGAPPGCLMVFQYAGIMKVLEAEDLLFDRNDISKVLQLYNVEADSSEIGEILKLSIGYPLGVMITVRHLGAGRSFGPGIIKYPFWQMTNAYPQAFYVCLNQSEAYAPTEIGRKSVCMDVDIGNILEQL